MNPRILSSLLVGAVLLSATPSFAQQQPRFPAPSPLCTVTQAVGLTSVGIVYSRPGVKGRTVFGGIVPYGQTWRTGANAATRLTFSTPVKIEGTEVPAGTYALWTIPGESEWTIILSKSTAQQYNQQNDQLRVKVKPVKLSESVETFTIDINDLRDESATINLIWEKVRVPVKLQVDVSSTLIPQIEAIMAAEETSKPPFQTYYSAAMYYYDHGLDIQKAKKWIDAAAAQREAFYVLHLQAKIRSKVGDKEGAIAAAKRSTELAKQANDSNYVRLNEELIASLK